MRSVPIIHSIRQLALVVAGFLVAIVLIESDGLANWANHLEIGALRTVAVPITAAIQKTISPIGVAAARQHSLENLARVGWSDDEALLAAVAASPNPAGVPAGSGSGSGSPSGRGAADPNRGNTPHINTYANAKGSDTPLVATLPKAAALAPLSAIVPGRPRVVALAGDSMMAVGLSNTLMRRAAGDTNLHIVKAFRSGTGLARPEVFNWMEQYPAMIGNEKPDVVIVAIGANDGQGFVVDKKVLPFGTPEWIKVYQERVASYLAMVGANGARVIWVGLPPMKAPSYNDKIALINRISYTVVSGSPNAVFWSSSSFVGDDAGGFREYITQANGKTMRLRQTDGIHLSDEGADLLSAVLVPWLSPPVPKPDKPEETAGTSKPAKASAKTPTSRRNTRRRG